MQHFAINLRDRDMIEELLNESRIYDTIVDITRFAAQRGVSIPWDLTEDLTYLCRKWARGDLSGDPYRGIIGRSEVRRNAFGTARPSTIYSIDPNWPYRMFSDFYGDGHLVNGQVWPNRICMVRDGAHRHQEAGICGNKDGGAQAIVLGQPWIEEYADTDCGNEIWYVGTAAREREPAFGDGDNEARTHVTAATELLFTSIITQNDVRVFRSAKLPKINSYRPPEGFRYDGTYKVTDRELLEPLRSVYRFKMARNAGQGPIRNYSND